MQVVIGGKADARVDEPSNAVEEDLGNGMLLLNLPSCLVAELSEVRLDELFRLVLYSDVVLRLSLPASLFSSRHFPLLTADKDFTSRYPTNGLLSGEIWLWFSLVLSLAIGD